MAAASLATVHHFTPQQLSFTRYATETLFGPLLYQHYMGWQSSFLCYNGAQSRGSELYQRQLREISYSDVLGGLPSAHNYQQFMHVMVTAGSRIVFPREGQKEDPSMRADKQASERPRQTVCGHRMHPEETSASPRFHFRRFGTIRKVVGYYSLIAQQAYGFRVFVRDHHKMQQLGPTCGVQISLSSPI
ncbi:hypothetical protein EJ07DRAFT_158367 [Lizonia empirigonia]|nr:hypothetical protein EJ07DRAFT_158974 [Lizonia empirigonia]KAF1354449.1 hypothetical protein EJ07DRAFT_158367 [Lizonia empirigonia]